VVYLHGNSSSRLAAKKYLPLLIPLRVNVCAFDFSGSGRSEGEFISLGGHEQQDVAAVLGYLRATLRLQEFVLWGTSMGAATALLYAGSDPDLACLVLDSPFSDLERLVQELAGRFVNLPGFVLPTALGQLRDYIQAKIDYDILAIKPILSLQQIFTPAVFLSGTEDSIIDHSHTVRLYDSHKAAKELLLFKGDHNDRRPNAVLRSVLLFIAKYVEASASAIEEVIAQRGE
jgi:pimeloyl-ACP methyl ester carboxylesterase